ncbi:bifunctional phosphatase PAP2/diacylglycerol kinase family protein [Nocardia sp. NBC_01327]|uniref:bifunctional phosphatase PAP2/diacylglycerol kinase family protein n=1 Tax=Nocardia sp. NBC_01327 TaxID=2903593 RepID=UPI002E160B2E|nr:phosphatase PAP2 family protein [Nocardia sp. NBC_01327]
MTGWLSRKFYRVGTVDRAISGAVARIPASPVDIGMLRLTRSADHGLLWAGVAVVLAAQPGATRRAALRGVVSVGGASLTANLVLKTLFARRRPAADLLPPFRRLINAPTSSSFPSGHSATAVAFATAVAMESPRAALVVAPLAATVAYSRVHTGVHWASDVVAGAAVGSAVAWATRRWWPVRGIDEAAAREVRDAPALNDGAGLVILVNPGSGDANHDPTGDVVSALPAATVLRGEPGRDAAAQLETALEVGAEHQRAAGAEGSFLAGAERVLAVGAVGGDGTITAAADIALRHGLPLVVVPGGTLNHFARDLGVSDLAAAVEAVNSGAAVEVSIGSLQMRSESGSRTTSFINTASIGGYPDLVRLREKWQGRWGKWPAFAAALTVMLRRAQPIRVRLDDRWHEVWFLFVGNGPYLPHGAVPAFRSHMDTGLLDVRWLRADLRFSRTRAVVALSLAAIAHSRVYGERQVPELTVHLSDPVAVAADGEVLGEATELHFSVAGRVVAYRGSRGSVL